MSDKSFEQQVREELSDLRMKPNAAVWESVAASLQKERKRRWALWVLVLLTAISCATFWWHVGETTKDKLVSNMVPLSDKKGNLNKINNKSEKNSQPENDTLTNRAVPEATRIVKEITANIETQKNSHKYSPIYRKEKTQPSRVNTNTDFEVIPQSGSPIVIKEKKEDELEKRERKQVVESQKESQVYKQQKKDTINNETKRDGTPQTADFITASASVPIKTDTNSSTKEELLITEKKNVTTEIKPVTSLSVDSVIKKDRIKKAGKWDWYIVFNAGTSGIRNSLRSLLEQTNIRAYDNAFSGNSIPTTTPPGTGGAINPVNVKPVVRDAFSFGSSIELMRKIGKKEKHAISFTAGYHLLTTRTGVGRSMIQDTVRFSNVNVTGDGDKYYAVKDSARYTSYYHFIQFGVRYYHALTWFKSMDIKWYAGLSANALISSNGLHLGSTGSSAYLFENRSLLRTLQMDMIGGVDFRLGSTKQILLGPQVQYILSNLSKQSGVNQHLFRPSVRLAFLLDKRK